MNKTYPATLSALRQLLSDLQTARDEMSDEIRAVQAEIDLVEAMVKPKSGEIEMVVREAISSRWPQLKVGRVSEIYDIYTISIVED